MTHSLPRFPSPFQRSALPGFRMFSPAEQQIAKSECLTLERRELVWDMQLYTFSVFGSRLKIEIGLIILDKVSIEALRVSLRV